MNNIEKEMNAIGSLLARQVAQGVFTLDEAYERFYQILDLVGISEEDEMIMADVYVY